MKQRLTFCCKLALYTSVREREFPLNTQDMCTTLMEGTNDSFAFLKFGLQLSEE